MPSPLPPPTFDMRSLSNWPAKRQGSLTPTPPTISYYLKLHPGFQRIAPVIFGTVCLFIPVHPQAQTPSIPPTQQTVSAALTDPQPTATLHGTILYPDGTPLRGAQISLTAASGAPREAISGPDGSFNFNQLSAGSFLLTVSARGMQTQATPGTLAAGQPTVLPPLTLRVATVLTQIEAISEQQQAEIDVQSEESQRLLGVLPNFFVTYNPGAVPLSTRQKFRLSARTLIDPATFAVAGVGAGIEQATGSYSGFGRGAAGYGRRYGAEYGDAFTGILLTGAVFPSLFHQDPRYFYKGAGGFKARLWYVITRSVIQKGDNGAWQPAYSNLLGSLGSGLISNTYYPSQNKHWPTFTLKEFGLGIAGNAGGNFLEEFVFNHLTTKKKP